MSAMSTLTKWGNGAGLLIPKSVREDAGLRLGDRVRIEVREGCVLIYPEESEWTLHSLMDGYDGPPPDYVDTGEPYGREVW